MTDNQTTGANDSLSSQTTGANDSLSQEGKIKNIIAEEIANLKKDLISPTDDKINLREEINSLKKSLEDITKRLFNESDFLISQKTDNFKSLLTTSITTELNNEVSPINQRINGLNKHLGEIKDTLSIDKPESAINAINNNINGIATTQDQLKQSVELITQNTENSKKELKKLLDVLLSYKLLEEANKLIREDRIKKVEEWRKTVASFKKLVDSDGKTQDINSIISELLTIIDTNLSDLIETWEKLPKKTTVSPEKNKDAILQILGLDSKKS